METWIVVKPKTWKLSVPFINNSEPCTPRKPIEWTSGHAFGRPKVGEEMHKERTELQDMKDRNAVEGGFGVGKRKFGLGCIMARLKEQPRV